MFDNKSEDDIESNGVGTEFTAVVTCGSSKQLLRSNPKKALETPTTSNDIPPTSTTSNDLLPTSTTSNDLPPTSTTSNNLPLIETIYNGRRIRDMFYDISDQTIDISEILYKGNNFKSEKHKRIIHMWYPDFIKFDAHVKDTLEMFDEWMTPLVTKFQVRVGWAAPKSIVINFIQLLSLQSDSYARWFLILDNGWTMCSLFTRSKGLHDQAGQIEASAMDSKRADEARKERSVLETRKSKRLKVENVRYKDYVVNESSLSEYSVNQQWTQPIASSSDKENCDAGYFSQPNACCQPYPSQSNASQDAFEKNKTSKRKISAKLVQPTVKKPKSSLTYSGSESNRESQNVNASQSYSLDEAAVDAAFKKRFTQKRKISEKQVQPTAKKPKTSQTVTYSQSELSRESTNVNTSQSYSLDEAEVDGVDSSTNSGPLNSSAPQYLSNESVSDDEDVREEMVKKIRGVGKDWIFVEKFNDRKTAEDKMASLADFSRDYHHGTSNGKKIYFHCKQKACPAMYQLFHNNTTTLMLKSSEHVHTINVNPISLSRIPQESKSKIEKYREIKLKPKAILSTMRNNHPELPLPTLKQLYGLNSRASKGENKISLGELEQWVTERSTIPDGVHTVFVVHFEIDYDVPHFRFFLSTRNLLSQSIKSKIVHADTTYKLNYEGFPILVVGVTDLDRHLHKSGVAVCTDEQTADFEFIFRSLANGIHKEVGQCFLPKTLVADAAGAIHNGFTNVFGELLIIMCWAHLKRAVKKRYRGKPFIDAILSDLDLLQLSPSVESFHIALKLFFEKWKKEEEFIAYFKEQWVDQNGNWFEGVQKFTPKTDNALEGTNKWIKDNHTMRERRPLAQFLNDLVKMVNDWSCEYIQHKTFVSEPTIDLPLWTKSYQWVKLGKRVTIVLNGANDNLLIFKVPATGFDAVVEFNLSQCKSLDEFKKYVFACVVVT